MRLEEVYTTPFHTHNPMEPHVPIALWDRPVKLTPFETWQGIFGDPKRMADLLGLQPENVRVVSLFIGVAVANAIYDATGKRIRDLPITPDKLL